MNEFNKTSYGTYTPVKIKNCFVSSDSYPPVKLLSGISWELKPSHNWLITGPNGKGKEVFIQALTGEKKFSFDSSGEKGEYKNDFAENTLCVSLEMAARLIKEERDRDESDYIEGGIDHGRTARKFISEIFEKKHYTREQMERQAQRLETFPEVKLCGIEKILDRGIKYLSTGEIRRTLLCKALLSDSKILVLSNPFDGLDAGSKRILSEFFSSISLPSASPTSASPEQTKTPDNKNQEKLSRFPIIILAMDNCREIPDSVTDILEFDDFKITFSGSREDFISFTKAREEKNKFQKEQEMTGFLNSLKELQDENFVLFSLDKNIPLVEMNNVNVGWDGKKVLQDFNWKLFPGQHTLIRGPNGSGKTTLLELITGDNMQVFSNDVKLFGKKRGSGETIWEIKAKLGIVSYRLHLEYRMVGGTDLEAVLLSGFHDSIGLYEKRSPVEQLVAKKWLALGGFQNREKESFSSLSYGEQRALLILRAAVKCPPLLILDEPCHGLDDSYRDKILNLIQKIASTGTTTLLHVTHDPAEALPIEKHILELCPGNTPMYRHIEI